MATEEERKTLQQEFEEETETKVINGDGEFDIDYVRWLEDRVLFFAGLIE